MPTQFSTVTAADPAWNMRDKPFGVPVPLPSGDAIPPTVLSGASFSSRELPIRMKEGSPRYKYTAFTQSGNKDIFVWEALKLHHPRLARALRNATRRPAGTKGLYEGIMKYDEPLPDISTLSPRQQAAANAAYELTRRAFKLPSRVKPHALEGIIDTFDLSTAAGASWPGKRKRDVRDEINRRAKECYDKIIRSKPDDDCRRLFPPVLLGQRGGPSVISEEKTRPIWIYPAELLCVEATIADPIYEQLTKQWGDPMFYGQDPEQLMGVWWSKVEIDGLDKIYGLDISSFDAHVSSWQIDMAFEIIFENIDFFESEHPEVKTDRSRRRLETHLLRRKENLKIAIREYFKCTPFQMPDGRFFIKDHGVPSGTKFTQLADSIVNYWYIQYAGLLQNARVRNLSVLGDDSAFTSPDFDLARATSDLADIGVVIHPDKVSITDNPNEYVVLGYGYSGCRRRRETGDWFFMALCPERTVTDVRTSFGRLFGIWHAGGKYDLDYCRFLEFFQTCYPVPETVTIPRASRIFVRMTTGVELPQYTKIGNKHKFSP